MTPETESTLALMAELETLITFSGFMFLISAKHQAIKRIHSVALWDADFDTQTNEGGYSIPARFYDCKENSPLLEETETA